MVSIVIQPQNSHGPITLTEKFNRHNLKKFVTMGMCDDAEYTERLGKYVKAAKDASHIEVQYTNPGIGRLQACTEQDTTVLQMNMWNTAKGAALHGLYHDVDVRSAHPTFLWQIMKQEGLAYERCTRRFYRVPLLKMGRF
jgi:hypothetical protein